MSGKGAMRGIAIESMPFSVPRNTDVVHCNNFDDARRCCTVNFDASNDAAVDAPRDQLDNWHD
jgi:hypothetical protein